MWAHHVSTVIQIQNSCNDISSMLLITFEVSDFIQIGDFYSNTRQFLWNVPVINKKKTNDFEQCVNFIWSMQSFGFMCNVGLTSSVRIVFKTEAFVFFPIILTVWLLKNLFQNRYNFKMGTNAMQSCRPHDSSIFSRLFFVRAIYNMCVGTMHTIFQCKRNFVQCWNLIAEDSHILVSCHDGLYVGIIFANWLSIFLHRVANDGTNQKALKQQ